MIDTFFKFSKGNDFFLFCQYLAFGKAAQDASSYKIFTAGHVGVKSTSQFEQTTHLTLAVNTPRGRSSQTAQQSQEGAFSRTVMANDAEFQPMFHGKGDITQCPKKIIFAVKAFEAPDYGIFDGSRTMPLYTVSF
jgi:hypothetical protein